MLHPGLRSGVKIITIVRSNRIFILLCLASVVILAVYIYWSRTKENTAAKSSEPLVEATASPTIATPLTNSGEAHKIKTENQKNKAIKQVFFRYNGLDN